MQIPRFRIRTLMIAFAVVSFWLATFGLPDQSRTGEQLRLSMIMAVCIASGFAAIYFRAKRRAFWVAFFVTLLLLYGQFQFRSQFLPSVYWIAASWAEQLNQGRSKNDSVTLITKDSIWIALLLGFSAIVGFIVAEIYDRSPSKK
jgi:hypothetical protein